MSHAYLEEFMVEAQMGLRYPVRVDLGKLGELDFLKAYMRPEAALLAPEELGRHIDDGLVECISFELWGLEAGEGAPRGSNRRWTQSRRASGRTQRSMPLR